MGMEPTFEAEEAIERANVIIDCTPVGNENKKILYNKYAGNGRGFVAQGSEYGFGKMYARGINDKALVKARTISSRSSVVTRITRRAHRHRRVRPEKEDNLDEGVSFCMRRANDLSQEGEFIAAPEAGNMMMPNSAPIKDGTRTTSLRRWD